MYIKLFKSVSILILLLVLCACSEEESPVEPEEPEVPAEAVDIYNYIALRNDGTLFTIGDNTGKVAQTGRIAGIEFNTVFNAIASSDSRTFVQELRLDPPRSVLYIWNKNNGQTESTILNFPEEEFGPNTGLMSLDWDESSQSLIGITRENMEQDNNGRPIKVVRINPENFQVESLDIDLSTEGYANVFSTGLVGEKLYATTSKNTQLQDSDLLEIDLNQNLFKRLILPENTSTIISLGYSGTGNELFGFSPVPNSNLMAEVRPVRYDVDSETLNEVSEIPRISALNFAHKTFYNEEANEFAELVGANNKKSLLRYNPSEETYELVELTNSDNLSTLISIIGVRKVD